MLHKRGDFEITTHQLHQRSLVPMTPSVQNKHNIAKTLKLFGLLTLLDLSLTDTMEASELNYFREKKKMEWGVKKKHLLKKNQQLIPHCPAAAAFWVGEVKGSIRTHSNEKMEARRMDQTMTIVGVRFVRPKRPLRKG